jgi:hypothetical protein
MIICVRGGLELSASGAHRGTTAVIKTRPELARRLADPAPDHIREHPDSPAPVSPQVSGAPFITAPLQRAGRRMPCNGSDSPSSHPRSERGQDMPDSRIPECPARGALDTLSGALAT